MPGYFTPTTNTVISVSDYSTYVRDQLVNELLMLFMSLKDGHRPSVLRPFRAPSPVSGRLLKGRRRRSDGEGDSPMGWYRRRQERKAAVRAARLMVALNECASSRPRRVRATARVGATGRKHLAA